MRVSVVSFSLLEQNHCIVKTIPIQSQLCLMVDEPDFERKEQGRVYFGIWRIKRQFLANELRRVCIATANVQHIEKDGGKLQASIRI